MYTVLIVDDEAKLREVLGMALEGMGYIALSASSGEEALQILEQRHVHLVLCDLRMPKMNGRILLETIKSTRPELPVIIMTAFATVKDAVKLIKIGAFDYLAKPFDLDALEATVTSALRFYTVSNSNALLREELQAKHGPDAMIGESAVMKEIFQHINEVSASNASVLITGESGTGKELVAKAIHASSNRRSASFVTVNCAAIHESLLESELFGHVKGAFTGATSNRVGRFAQADGGTFFLDEIGDMPWSLQAKILRCLQDKIIEPVGSQNSIQVDVRILAATNQNLEVAIAEGRFRSDLFFRLNVYPIVMPPLRRRVEDIPLLVEHFAARFAAQMGKRPIVFAPDALLALQQCDWPGNIRELQNIVERLSITHSGKTIQRDMVAGWLMPKACSPVTEAEVEKPVSDLSVYLEDTERKQILAALKLTGGVQAKAAVLLNISERSIWHRIKKLGISLPL